MKKITFNEFEKAMCEAVENGKSISGVVVFTEDSFDKAYPEMSRSYRVSSNNKYFYAFASSHSMFGDCLDNTDDGVNLSYYMEKGWKVDYCYLDE